MLLFYTLDGHTVTPYAGVWIEIGAYSHGNRFYAVTPYAGVWIEIFVEVDCGSVF